MKTLQFIILFLIFSITATSQVAFEPGYFITNQGEKIDCLIKNVDWKHNPTSFDYKMTDSSEIITMSIQLAGEFQIDRKLKFERYMVNIDRSSNILSQLSESRSPDFSKEQLYLKILIEGKASLYQFSSEKFIRYFYSTENTKVEQLIYKRYIVKSDRRYDGEDKILQNLGYQQQLINSLQCDDITRNIILASGYKKSELVNLFIRYNDCTQSTYMNYASKAAKSKFNLKLKPGLTYSSFSLRNLVSSYRNTVFDSEFSYSIGIEAEIVLPFQRNKWSVFSDPSYQYYKTLDIEGIYPKTMDYSYISIPFGIKHYFFFSDKSRLFINASLNYDIALNSTIIVDYGQVLDVTSAMKYRAGIGYNYSRYCVELYYNFHINPVGSYSFWYGDFTGISLNFAYTIFQGI